MKAANSVNRSRLGPQDQPPWVRVDGPMGPPEEVDLQSPVAPGFGPYR